MEVEKDINVKHNLFKFVRVTSDGLIEDLIVNYVDHKWEVAGSLSDKFIEPDFSQLDFIEANKHLWAIKKHTAYSFEVHDSKTYSRLIRALAKQSVSEADFPSEKPGSDWVKSLPDSEFTEYKEIQDNFEFDNLNIPLVLNGKLLASFLVEGDFVVVPMDREHEYNCPEFNRPIAYLAHSWDNMVSGTDWFYLLESPSGRYYIFCYLDDRPNEFHWIPKYSNLMESLVAFLDYLKSGDQILLDPDGLTAMLYDMVYGVDQEHMNAEHSDINEDNKSGAHYFNLEINSIELVINANTAFIEKLLDIEIEKLSLVVAKKILKRQYCSKSKNWADGASFTEAELQLVVKYQQFNNYSIEDARNEYIAAKNALDSRDEIVKSAMALLNLENVNAENLFAQTKEMINLDPANESRYWEAFWNLKEEPSKARLEIAERNYELSKDIETAVKELEWPSDWNIKFAPVWLQLAGTKYTVKYWHNKGWLIESIMLDEVLPSEWNGNLTARVRNSEPPDPLDDWVNWLS